MKSIEPAAIIKKSIFYKEVLAERDEILRLKWLESQKAGAYIGFEAALLMWVRQHRKNWRSSRRDTHRIVGAFGYD